MSIMKNRKIGTRLTLGFGVVLLTFILAVVTTSILLMGAQKASKQVEEETVPYLMTAYELDLAATEVSEAITDAAATHHKESIAEAEKNADRFIKEVGKFKEMFKKENDTKALAEMETLEKDFLAFFESGKHMVNMYIAEGVATGNKYMEAHDKKHEELIAGIEKLQQSQIDEAKVSTKKIDDSIRNVQTVLYLMSALAIVLGVLIAYFTTRSIVRPIAEAVVISNKLAEGDLGVTIDIQGTDETGQLLSAMKNMTNKIGDIVQDIDALTEAAQAGRLSTRADASKHKGDYAKIVKGINNTLEALITPLNTSAGYMDQLSRGEIPARITEEYKGDFNNIKSSINSMIEKLGLIINDIKTLTEAAREGRLDTRADASKHQGDYGKIIAGINQTLDALITPLKTSAAYMDQLSKGDIPAVITEEYKGDFNNIKESINSMIDNLTRFATDVRTAADNVASGSQQLSSGSEQMSQGTTEQAASAEEASSSVEEMNATIKQNADNASQTEKIALKSSKDAQESGKAVSETVSAMKEIAKKISIMRRSRARPIS